MVDEKQTWHAEAVSPTGIGPAAMQRIDRTASRNFEIARGAAIVMVICGHFFTGLGLWPAVTVGLFGLTGLLNWFGLADNSPFGAGMWFLTLLLIFYAIYPLLRRIGASRWTLWIMGLASLAACVACQYLLPMEHMLWLTAALNSKLHIRQLNFVMLLAVCIAVVSWLLRRAARLLGRVISTAGESRPGGIALCRR